MHTVEELRGQLDELNREAEGREFTAQERERWNSINEKIDELQVRRDRVAELGRNPRATEAGTTPPRRRVVDTGQVRGPQ